MIYKNEVSWYAVFVATGEEDKVKARINFRMQGRLRAIVPKRRLRERRAGKWEEKLRTLFPGYILLNGIISDELYGLVRGIPGVIRFLGDRDGPLQIYKSEIEVISRLTCDCEIIGYSRVYAAGEKVMVIDGPLYGMEGSIKSIDKRKGRVKVLLNLMNEPRLVELSVALVESA